MSLVPHIHVLAMLTWKFMPLKICKRGTGELPSSVWDLSQSGLGLGIIIICIVGIGLVGIGVVIGVVRKIRMADHVVEVSWSVSARSPDPPLVYQVAPATFQACLRHQSCLSPAERARRETTATAAQAICVNNSTGPDPIGPTSDPNPYPSVNEKIMIIIIIGMSHFSSC